MPHLPGNRPQCQHPELGVLCYGQATGNGPPPPAPSPQPPALGETCTRHTTLLQVSAVWCTWLGEKRAYLAVWSSVFFPLFLFFFLKVPPSHFPIPPPSFLSGHPLSLSASPVTVHSHTPALPRRAGRGALHVSHVALRPGARAPGVPPSLLLLQESRWVSGAQDLVCLLHHPSVAV